MKSKTVVALEIIRDNKIDSGKQFALLLWPESDGWKRVINTGRGATHGRGMSLAGSSFLGRLSKKGLICFSVLQDQYTLTEKGLELIKESQAKAEQMILPGGGAAHENK